MKQWFFIFLATAFLSASLLAPSHASEPVEAGPLHAEQDASEAILASVDYSRDDLGVGDETVVGRLVLRRQFLGSRADPMYRDSVGFHFFDGSKLRFLKFAADELEQKMIDQLKTGRSVPAVMAVDVQRIRVGHDGVNASDRLVTRVVSCLPTTVDVVCAAAKQAGLDASACDAFTRAVEPDVSQDGIAVALDRVAVRPKILPQWKTAGVFISGIRVFNTTVKDVTIEIVGLTIEQDGVGQACPLNEQTSARTWRVKANSWSDGVYTQGKMPKNRWTFDPADPINPEKPVSVHLKLKINGDETITLKRIVAPMGLK